MWRTSEGDRVLTGAEGRLFQEGLASLVDWLEDSEGELTVGIDVFDSLSFTEKLAALDQVGGALLLKGIPEPALTAVLEGAIAAVYMQLLDDIEIEIDLGRQLVRKLVSAASKSVGEQECPSPRSKDMERWQDTIEALMDMILWDRDWRDQFVEPDDPPELAEHIRNMVDIDTDYYSAVPSDPNPQQLQLVRERLSMLCKMAISD